MNRHFSKEDIKVTSSFITEMQIKTRVNHYLTPTRIARTKKSDKKTSIDKDVEKLKP